MKTFFKYSIVFLIGCLIGIFIGGYLTYQLAKGPLLDLARSTAAVNSKPVQEARAPIAPRPARKEAREKKRIATSAAATVKPRTPATPAVVARPNYEESVEFSAVELPLGTPGVESYFKVADAYVSHQEGPDVLTVEIQVRCPLQSSPTALNQVSTSLIAHGSELPGSGKFFSGIVGQGAKEIRHAKIGLPPGLTRIALRVQYFGRAVDIPLTLKPIAKQ